jgi:catechol-2,3-dioxygenase
MITHFAEVTLLTTSIAGVMQLYKERLGYLVTEQSDGKIGVRVNAHTQLTFVEANEKLAPVHLAFEVPMSAFEQVALHLQQQLGQPLTWPDGISITSFSDGKSVYYKDLNLPESGLNK